ncbi:bacteriocin [Boseaceae bacterium BT-24-1]|nr:bacteriocin [Boseaceae bacterium BT-24-1]
MKKVVILVAVSAALGACTPREERATGGALLGAGAGALLGGLATGQAGGALAGAAIGGAGGAIIGSATAPSSICVGRDDWGRRYHYEC